MGVFIRVILLAVIIALTGCASTLPPPKNKEHVGAIFNQYPQWYRAAKKTEKKYGVPVNVQMAIIYYESSFKGDARPPFKKIMGIPTGQHISTAYGYAQALDGTWNDYLASNGGFFTKRNKFECATDFIGWYSERAKMQLGIPSDDPYNLYLAYHEGLGGYERKSYLRKPWLMKVAKNVAMKSYVYGNQLAYFEHPNDYDRMPIREMPLGAPTEESPLQELDAPSYYAFQAQDEGIQENI